MSTSRVDESCVEPSALDVSTEGLKHIEIGEGNYLAVRECDDLCVETFHRPQLFA